MSEIKEITTATEKSIKEIKKCMSDYLENIVFDETNISDVITETLNKMLQKLISPENGILEIKCAKAETTPERLSGNVYIKLVPTGDYVVLDYCVEPENTNKK